LASLNGIWTYETNTVLSSDASIKIVGCIGWLRQWLLILRIGFGRVASRKTAAVAGISAVSLLSSGEG
jgi:hypothetical protein